MYGILWRENPKFLCDPYLLFYETWCHACLMQVRFWLNFISFLPSYRELDYVDFHKFLCSSTYRKYLALFLNTDQNQLALAQSGSEKDDGTVRNNPFSTSFNAI